MYGNYGSSADQPPNMYAGYQTPKKRHTGRKVIIWVLVVLALLVALDIGAKAFAENEAAIQIQKHGFPKKPTVLIGGFPFLTQVVTRHFNQITIKSGNIPEGPITITKLNVVADNVHLNSRFNGGTAGPLHGTILFGLGSIGDALSVAGPVSQFLGGGSSALKIVSVGSDEVKGSLVALGGFVSWSAVWQVKMAGSQGIRLHLVRTGGQVPSGLVSAANNISIPLSGLPAGLQFTGGLNASATGITAHVFARSLAFGE